MAQRDQFANFVAAKIGWIRVYLDFRSVLQNFDVWSASSSPVLWDVFSTISLEDVDRVVGEMRPTAQPGLLEKPGKGLQVWL